MVTCKNCLHFDVCRDYYNEMPTDCEKMDFLTTECNGHYKDKSEYVKVVRCRDCVHYKATDTGCWCDMALNLNDAAVTPQHYCSKGERR